MGTTVTLLAIAEVVWVLVLSAWLILERRSPVATLAWILALAWLPLLGAAVYFLVGPRRLRRKRGRYQIVRARRSEIAAAISAGEEGMAVRPPVDARWQEFMTLVERSGDGPPLRSSRLEVLPSGDECFDALAQAIAGARHHVHVEYYIWEPDKTGTRLRDLLCERARSGVHVRFLVDAIGSSALGRRFLRPMRDAGVEVAWFNPLSLARFRPDLLNFRTHRKIVICDGHVGFTGGINVSDDVSFRVKGQEAWRDTHVRIEGPPVGWLQVVFLEDWHFATGIAPRHAAYFPDRQAACDGPWVQIVASGPDHDLYAIHKFYFTAIAGARQRVLITTPYFVPDESILTALVTAALRGAEVKILVSTSGSPRLAFAAARSYFEDLVRAGVRIYQYGPEMLHGKTLVVDRDVAVVGTANMDNRSFRLNFEVMAAIYDGPTAALLAEQFEADLRHAKEYRVRDARRTPLVQRMVEATARLLSPLL